MPRPRVAPQDRQRAVRACLQCRASKKRCNGQQPCPNCIRKGITRSCVFTDPAADTSGSESIRPTSRTSLSSQDGAGSRREAHAVLGSSLSGPIQEDPSPEASYRTQPRLLNSLKGDKVFVGGSASLSFLQYIRDVVSQSLGNSRFSQYAEQDYMLESPQLEVRPIAELPLDFDKQSEFIDLAYTASLGLIEFWAKAWVLETINQGGTTSDARSQLKLAVAHTVLAIGAQCVATDEDTSSIARSYFADAQEHVFAARLQVSNLEIVQALLLMTFYLMGACERNAAYIYLGIAVRIAFVLGLHCDDASKSNNDESSHIRDLTWRSLVTLDVMISSILGRPAAISTQPMGEDIIFRSEAQQSDNIALHANFRLACLLDQKVQKLYLTEKVTAKSARTCLDLLRRWSASIPEDLRRVPNTTSDRDSLNKAIGGLHVSCAYYFGVMLVSRPFLVLHLTNRLTLELQKPRSLSENALHHGDLAEVEEIANACMNAATYLIQTCSEIQHRGILPGNMRIVKAWTFAAGLVLGFDMFTLPQSEPEVEKAFRNCCDILQMLSNKSIQAGHYFEILTSLFDAITARRQQMSTKNKRTSRPIVEKIMAFDSQQNTQENQAASVFTGVDPSPVASSNMDGSYDQNWPQDFVVDLDFQTMMSEPFLNWGSTDFITWA